MLFTPYSSSKKLHPYVAGYHLLKKAVQGDPQCMLPNGYPCLVFQLGESKLRYYKQKCGAGFYLPDCTVLGQYTHPYFLDGVSDTGVLVIYLKPHLAMQLLHHPLWLFTNQPTDAQEIFGSGWQKIVWQVRQASDPTRALQLVENLLFGVFPPVSGADKAVLKALEHIHASHGSLSIKELCAQTGLGRRYLEQRFRLVIGLSPKGYAKILRFNYVLHLLQTGYQSGWSDLTYLGGYFDQSHFIRNFREFSGVSPTAYCKASFGEQIG